jgi:hypothetical protein
MSPSLFSYALRFASVYLLSGLYQGRLSQPLGPILQVFPARLKEICVKIFFRPDNCNVIFISSRRRTSDPVLWDFQPIVSAFKLGMEFQPYFFRPLFISAILYFSGIYFSQSFILPDFISPVLTATAVLICIRSLLLTLSDSLFFNLLGHLYSNSIFAERSFY